MTEREREREGVGVTESERERARERERESPQQAFKSPPLVFFKVLRFVIPSLLFTQRPPARLPYNDPLFLRLCSLLPLCFSALSFLLCLGPATDCSAQRDGGGGRGGGVEKEGDRQGGRKG